MQQFGALLVLVLVSGAGLGDLTQLGRATQSAIALQAEATNHAPALTSQHAAGVSDLWDKLLEPIGRGLRGFAGRLSAGVRDASLGVITILRGDADLPSPHRWPKALSGWLSRKASAVFSLIATSIRLRAPAQSLGGALADNLIELFFDPLTSFGREGAGQTHLIDTLVRVAGTSTPAQHDLVMRAVHTLPSEVLARINRYNVRFFVGTRPGNADRTRENPIYDSMSHNISLQFWPVERMETLYHEVGHALDNQNKTFAIGFERGSIRPGLGHYHYSSSDTFVAAYDRDFPEAGNGYYDTRDANGRAEAFAESFSLWYLDPQQLEWQWPNLYAYWQSNPLELPAAEHSKTLAQIESDLGLTLDAFDDAFNDAAKQR